MSRTVTLRKASLKPLTTDSNWKDCSLVRFHRQSARFPVVSPAENKARSNRGVDHFARHFSPDEVVEPLSRTMTWNQIVRIQIFEVRDDFSDILVGQRWHDVKAADNCMYLLDAGSGL